MKWTDCFVPLLTRVVLTEEYDVTVNGEKLIITAI